MIYGYLLFGALLCGVIVGYIYPGLKAGIKILLVIFVPLLCTVLIHWIGYVLGNKETWMWALITVPIMYFVTTPAFLIGFLIGIKMKQGRENK